ncbi:RNA polymerase sigma factor [Sphingomonas sp. MAHUQ-71]|uniref:RNA polymerase sigma factor n=2 Tax=Sphingomonas oryzagri TaxID=3042314 RepID=A0ABT6N5R7_9SPHN|nr:RNA polymerase sigma factor [Sphingomonas oryzagri]
MTIFTPAGSRAYLSAEAGNARRIRMAGTLDEAFMAHRPALLRYFRARGAGDEADDLLQDLWMKLSAAGSIEADDSLAYLYRMAHNLMLDRRRGAVRRRLREENYQEVIDDTDETPGAEHVLLAREALQRIEAVLAGLGPKTEHIFRRHRVEGIAQRDIAAEFGVTLSAIEKHLQKAYRAVAAAQADLMKNEADVRVREVKDDRR